jgi:hypothetical protein
MGEIKEWERVATDFLRHLIEVRGLAAQLRVLRDLRRLAEKRHALRDITEKIGEGLFELKTSHDRMEYRCITLLIIRTSSCCYVSRRKRARRLST